MTEAEYYALKAVQPLLDDIKKEITELRLRVIQLEVKANNLDEPTNFNLDNSSPEKVEAALRDQFYRDNNF